MAEQKAGAKNLSVGKALQIVDLMAGANGPLRLHDIATGVGLPASTALRFLNALAAQHYVGHEERSGRYFLTLKLHELGQKVVEQLDVRRLAADDLESLARQCEETTTLAMPDGLAALYVEVIPSPSRDLQVLKKIGARDPLHCSAAGKCFLAEENEDFLNSLIADPGTPAYTNQTISTKRGLMQEIERIRALGYAIDNEETTEGIYAMAAPVRNHEEEVVAAVSVLVPASRMDRARIDETKAQLLASARRISWLMGEERAIPRPGLRIVK